MDFNHKFHLDHVRGLVIFLGLRQFQRAPSMPKLGYKDQVLTAVQLNSNFTILLLNTFIQEIINLTTVQLILLKNICLYYHSQYILYI